MLRLRLSLDLSGGGDDSNGADSSPAAIVFAGTLVFATAVDERPAAAVERTRALHRVAFRAAEDAEPATPPADFVERRVVVMGTTLDVVVRLPEREAALAASERAVSAVARVEDLLTTWREGGPLWNIDHAPAGQSVAVDPELAAVLALVFEWSRRTGGAFDPTVLPLVEAWGLRSGGRIPSAEEIAAARRATGTDRFRLSAPDRTLVRLDERAGIDEGAWGKGYALDRAAERLARAGVADARLDLGGQVLVLGKDAGGRPWTVGLAHPDERERPVARLRLPSGTSLSTSGNSERGVTVAGRRIGHLLDPRTGRPASRFRIGQRDRPIRARRGRSLDGVLRARAGRRAGRCRNGSGARASRTKLSISPSADPGWKSSLPPGSPRTSFPPTPTP